MQKVKVGFGNNWTEERVVFIDDKKIDNIKNFGFEVEVGHPTLIQIEFYVDCVEAEVNVDSESMKIVNEIQAIDKYDSDE